MFSGIVLKDIKQVAHEEPQGSILFSRNKSCHVKLVILTVSAFLFLIGLLN